VRLRVESVVAARGLVFARPIEPGSMLATPRATLGGRRVKYFDLPRKLMQDGALDLELIGFYLEDPADVAHFPLGALVEYIDDER
jgi:hypothetical protein